MKKVELLNLSHRFVQSAMGVVAACMLSFVLTAVSTQAQAQAAFYRPVFHFSPERNWINDPVGLVFDGGEYHLFTQYNPYGDQWGHMSWGHAVSKDLISWQELPVALKEENGIGIFTGSAVLDAANTSGFGKNRAAPLVAIYTGNSTGLQTQNLAYSNDGGRTWTKYAGNPILDLHEAEFRDPMVFWHEPTRRWVMVVSLAPKHKVFFYSSPDLKSWTKTGEFGSAGANGVPNWECPNLFELPVANAAGKQKWVLEVGVGDNGPAGGSAAQYFVGEFDGATFTDDNSADKTLWVDYGSDFYAAQTWSNIPTADGRRIAIAWMNNWQYASRPPTSPWRGQMSLPRSLELVQTKDGLRLTQAPVKELQALRGEHLQLRDANWKDAQVLFSRRDWPEALEIEAELQLNDVREFGFVLRKGASYGTVVGYDAQWSRVFVDRTHSGDVIVGPTFAARHEAPIAIQDGRVRLHIFLDRSSVELFANDGLRTITDLIYPREADRGIELFAVGNSPTVISLDVWTLKSNAGQN